MKKFDKWMFEIPVEDIQELSYDENSLEGEYNCICCGKEIKNPKYWVQMLNTNNLISSDEDFQESMGFFPIGNSCKNKLPNNFYFNHC